MVKELWVLSHLEKKFFKIVSVWTENVGLGFADVSSPVPSGMGPPHVLALCSCVKEETWGCVSQVSPVAAGVSSLTTFLSPRAAGTMASSQSGRPCCCPV